MNSKFKQCTKTVMDNISDPDIKFDNEGICNYVPEYISRLNSRRFSKSERKDRLKKIVNEIKSKGKNNKYDCVIGISGGVDSTYTALIVKELGLNPLAVHVDNGWNAEIAVQNIKQTVKILDIDLYTVVLNWEEFREIQRAFLLSSTPDCDIPTDHAIFASLYNIANKMKIKYLIIGSNIVTEGFLPPSWSYGHYDWKYIRSVNNIFGDKKNLNNFPKLKLFKFFKYIFINRIKRVTILDYYDFNTEKIIKILEKKLKYKPYKEKHYESVFTRFYQGYIMLRKFHMDKRKTHYSTLICSGLMNKANALKLLKKDSYPSKEMLYQDRDFFIKKFRISHEEFDMIMKADPKSFRNYPNNFTIIQFLWKFYRIFKYKQKNEN